jgi:hypothetical protein
VTASGTNDAAVRRAWHTHSLFFTEIDAVLRRALKRLHLHFDQKARVERIDTSKHLRQFSARNIVANTELQASIGAVGMPGRALVGRREVAGVGQEIGPVGGQAASTIARYLTRP